MSLINLIFLLLLCLYSGQTTGKVTITSKKIPDQTLVARNLPTETRKFRSDINQNLHPIQSPSCFSGNPPIPPLPVAFQAEDGPISPKEILHRIRLKVCQGSCSGPMGVPPSAVVVIRNDDSTNCEVSVGVSDALEAFARIEFNTGYTPLSDALDQCQESYGYIIDKCVSQNHDYGIWAGYVVFPRESS
jgi:hypothetical protein